MVKLIIVVLYQKSQGSVHMNKVVPAREDRVWAKYVPHYTLPL